MPLTRQRFVSSDLDQAVEYAKQEFTLGSESDPKSKRSALLSAQRKHGKPIPELQNLVELPKSCYQVWGWFLDLNNTRQSGFNGAQSISFTEIKAYFDLIEIKPMAWEVNLIKRFDNAFMVSNQPSDK